MPSRAISVIVPTYQEAAGLPRLLARLAAVREAHGLDLEVIISDDNSRDGTEEVVRSYLSSVAISPRVNVAWL